MPAPYSDDLREKVLAALEQGMRKSEASNVFAISRNTIDLWINWFRQTGVFSAETSYQRGSGHKIIDWDAFRQFAQKHGGKTQAQMADAWEGEISPRTIGRALKKVGFTKH